MTDLSRLARNFGLDDGRQPFVAAAQIGAEAVEVLRSIDDGASQSAALRAAAVPFVGVDVTALLEEALLVAREAGDREQEAWSLLACGNTVGGDISLVRLAHSAFVELNHPVGRALSQRTLAIRELIPRTEKAALLEEAGDLLISAGRQDDAYKSFIMAATFGSPDISPTEERRLLHRALDAAAEPMEKALTFRNLAWAAERDKDAAAAATYRAAEDELDVAAYGSRTARLQSDLEILQEEASWTPTRKRKQHRAKIEAILKELRTLEGPESNTFKKV